MLSKLTSPIYMFSRLTHSIQRKATKYSRIEKAAYSLDQLPERFRRYEKEPWRSRNLRVMPVDNYIIFYIVDNETGTVTVIRVMYGRRDTEKELDDMARQDN
jgi:toxin ParE1/3/4